MYKIYKHTCPNGLAYIGVTEEEKLYRRFSYGSGYSANQRFYADIQEYGWQNIEHTVIAECEDKEEAYALEKELIQQYKTYLPEFGYNSHYGKTKLHKEEVAKRKEEKKKILCVETGEVFDTLAAAGDSVNRTGEAIRIAIKQNRKCAKKTFTYIDP